MIIQCDKCQSKFKLDDSKVTPEGVKVKCKKCADIFMVFPENTEIKEESKPEEPELPKEELKGSIDMPSFELKSEDKKEEPAAPAAAGEFSWDQFGFESEDKKEEEEKEADKIEKTQAGENTEEFKFDFEEQFGKPEELEKTEQPEQSQPAVEEKKEETSGFDFEFDFEKFETQTKTEETGLKPETEGVKEKKSLEDFMKEEPARKEEAPSEFSFEIEEPSVAEAKPEAEARKSAEEEREMKEAPKEEPPSFEFDFASVEEKKAEIEPKEEPAAFQEFTFEETSPSLEKADTEMAKEEFVKKEAPAASEELSFTFQETDAKAPVFEEAKKDEPAPEVDHKELFVEEPKPASNWAVYIVSVLIVILVSGGGIAALWWQKAEMLEKEGSIGVSDVKTEYYESKTLDKVFVVTGKVTNAYGAPKSFLRVKCVLYDKGNKKLTEKIVYAGNTYTAAEVKELTYSEMEKGLNNKMGKSMINVDVPPGKSLPFMIIFDKQPEETVNMEVESL